MEKLTRRVSETFRRSPTKDIQSFYENENSSQPVHAQLGNLNIVYKDLQWKTDPEIDPMIIKQIETVEEKNRVLEAENQLMNFKMNILMDMLATTRLDLLRIQAQNSFGPPK